MKRAAAGLPPEDEEEDDNESESDKSEVEQAVISDGEGGMFEKE